MRNLERRVERVERLAQRHAKVMSRFAPECICYPKGSTPWVAFRIQYEIAFSVKCPAHGDRFSWDDVGKFVYCVKWLRTRVHRRILDGCPGLGLFSKSSRQVSEQFRKAYLASFPVDLWSAEEEEEKIGHDHRLYLRLQDGTRVQVSQSHYPKLLRDDGEVARSSVEDRRRQDRERATDRIWGMETLRTVGRLLSQRGLIIDPRLLGETA